MHVPSGSPSDPSRSPPGTAGLGSVVLVFVQMSVDVSLLLHFALHCLFERLVVAGVPPQKVFAWARHCFKLALVVQGTPTTPDVA